MLLIISVHSLEAETLEQLVSTVADSTSPSTSTTPVSTTTSKDYVEDADDDDEDDAIPDRRRG